jgi:hypothetical protein
MIQSQAPIYAAPLSVRNINISRLRNYKRSARLRSSDLRKRFKPNVNKSFTCYNEIALPGSPNGKRVRNTVSSERNQTQNISLVDMRNKRHSRKQRSTSKLNSGHPGPSEDNSLLDFTLNPKHERIVNLMEKGN